MKASGLASPEGAAGSTNTPEGGNMSNMNIEAKIHFIIRNVGGGKEGKGVAEVGEVEEAD
jgi:hypothetical protein